MNTLDSLPQMDNGAVAWIPECRPPLMERGYAWRNQGWAVVAALLAHACVLGLLFIPTPAQKAIVSNTEPPASVRVSMVHAPVPPPQEAPAPPAPNVLSTQNAKRVIAKSEPTAPKLPNKPKPAVPRPTQAPVKSQPAPPATKAPATPDEPVVAAQAGPTPSQADGEKLMALPTSGPKDVQTVGCRVPAPKYPRKALRLRLEGVVIVQLVIDPSGHVEQTNVIRSSGNPLLDAAATEAVAAASCTPYIENGRAISVRAAQPVAFNLNR